jgi:hypothetical protein
MSKNSISGMKVEGQRTAEKKERFANMDLGKWLAVEGLRQEL